MNCSLTTVNSLISAAIAALLGAIALAYWWPVVPAVCGSSSGCHRIFRLAPQDKKRVP